MQKINNHSRYKVFILRLTLCFWNFIYNRWHKEGVKLSQRNKRSFPHWSFTVLVIGGHRMFCLDIVSPVKKQPFTIWKDIFLLNDCKTDLGVWHPFKLSKRSFIFPHAGKHLKSLSMASSYLLQYNKRDTQLHYHCRQSIHVYLYWSSLLSTIFIHCPFDKDNLILLDVPLHPRSFRESFRNPLDIEKRC